MKTYKGLLTNMPANGIFVFGSNTQGRHGKGAALTAKLKFGAIYGQARGLQGRSYAIVTKDLTKPVHPSIPKHEIIAEISVFYLYARTNPHKDYYVVYGVNVTNLSAYTPQEMADMFSSSPIPDNIVFNDQFAKLVKPTQNEIKFI